MDEVQNKLWRISYCYLVEEGSPPWFGQQNAEKIYTYKWCSDPVIRIIAAATEEEALTILVEELPTDPYRKKMDRDKIDSFMKKSRRPYPYIAVELEELESIREGVWRGDSPDPYDVTRKADALMRARLITKK